MYKSAVSKAGKKKLFILFGQSLSNALQAMRHDLVKVQGHRGLISCKTKANKRLLDANASLPEGGCKGSRHLVPAQNHTIRAV
mmetsp:Transcript_12752/g.19841  ORF Transcript_12752/g.19841 Transcript_12752/m.19841 type:complete len:83 (-) Transcript_12752:94-342(-)